MNIQQMLLTPNPYSRPQTKLTTVSKIVVHWVGNAGTTAKNNRDYFEGLKVGSYKVCASSHYIIGLKGEIILCVPENEIAYHAKEANSYSIGIENCHPDWEGKFNTLTYQSLVDLCTDLCKRYGLYPNTDLLRHYDVNGKVCPKYYVQHHEAWEQFKKDVTNTLKKLNEADNLPRAIKIKLDGQIKEVESILYHDQNYIKLRDLESEHITIGYDSQNKMPIIETK